MKQTLADWRNLQRETFIILAIATCDTEVLERVRQEHHYFLIVTIFIVINIIHLSNSYTISAINLHLVNNLET